MPSPDNASKTYLSRLFCGVALERVSRSPRQSTATFSFSSCVILRFTTFTLTYSDRHRSRRRGAGRWPARRLKRRREGAARSTRNRLGKPSVAQSLDDLRRLTGSLRFPEKPRSYSEKLRHRKSSIAMAALPGP